MDFEEDLAWKSAFFKDPFNVDQCLSKFPQKLDLESLRKELKKYGTNLQQQMSEILKCETEAIVNLAEYLTSLNSKIENISVPICQLREEIRMLFDLTVDAESKFKSLLEDVKHNNTSKDHLHLKLGILTSSIFINKLILENGHLENVIILERVVNKYSFQRTYMDALGLLSSISEDIFFEVENKLINSINRKFLESFRENDIETLTKCLRMYDNLKKQDEAQNTIRLKVIRPALQSIVTETNLVKSKTDIKKIHDDVLNFMDTKINILYEILNENPDLKSFNFTLNSFWIEFDKQLKESLPHITAPGNPELFQFRFKNTWKTLLKIAEKCGDKDLVRKNDSFQDNLTRFNLPVYFEICFQRIVGKFESNLLDNGLKYAKNDTELKCKLENTNSLWTAITKCFSETVYMDQLADQFIKLSMMLLSRYLGWIDTTIKNDSVFADEDQKELYIIYLLIDIAIIESKIAPTLTDDPKEIQNTVFRILDPDIQCAIPKVFKCNKLAMKNFQDHLKDILITAKSDEMCKLLQNIGAIPRLYRRTNKNAPKEASFYVVEAVKPVVQFDAKFKSVITQCKKHFNDILDKVIFKVTRQYSALIQEVLVSVCKTEESLRRLKSRNATFVEENNSQSVTMSDEMKIREQIKLDVAYFVDNLRPLATNQCCDTLESLKKETN